MNLDYSEGPKAGHVPIPQEPLDNISAKARDLRVERGMSLFATTDTVMGLHAAFRRIDLRTTSTIADLLVA